MNELMNAGSAGRGTLREFDRLFKSMFSPFELFAPEIMGAGSSGFPQIEVNADDKEVKAQLPLPGFKNDQIEVEVVGDLLTIRAKRDSFVPGEKSHFLRKERSCTRYEETVRLPGAVRGQDAAAKYADGVLTVTVPRESEAMRNHVIPVK